MEAWISENLSVYGPWLVFGLLLLSGIGIPLGEEMITIPAGVLIAQGRLEYLPIIIAGYCGIVIADLMWFHISRTLGTRLLHLRWSKRLFHPRRILQAKHQLDHRGIWVIVMARFIPSSRTTAITVAGMFQMPFWKFASATIGCVLLTLHIQLGLGYLVGQEMEGTKSLAELFLRILGVVVALIGISLLIRWFSSFRHARRRPPRARVAWLRRFRRERANGKTSPAETRGIHCAAKPGHNSATPPVG